MPLSQAVFHVLLALADRRRHRRYYELTELGRRVLAAGAERLARLVEVARRKKLVGAAYHVGRRGILVLALCAGGRSPAPAIDKPLVEHIIPFADL